MRRNNSLLGLIGLVLLLFAGVAALFTRAHSGIDVLYIFINGLFGLFAVIATLAALRHRDRRELECGHAARARAR